MNESNGKKNNLEKEIEAKEGKKEEKIFLEIKKTIFFQCIGETMIAKYNLILYPILLYYLKTNNKIFTYNTTLSVILLFIFYFTVYYFLKLKNSNICFLIIEKILYLCLGYLAQFNLIFFDIYVIKDENAEISWVLFLIKLFMIYQIINKRIYFYIIGSYALLKNEIDLAQNFLIGNFYDIYKIFNLIVFVLEKNINRAGLFFSFYYALFALGSHYFICKFFLVVMNLIFILAQIYSLSVEEKEKN